MNDESGVNLTFEEFCIKYAAGDWEPRQSQIIPPTSLSKFHLGIDEATPESNKVNTLNDLSGYQQFIPAPQTPSEVLDLFKKTHHLTAPLGPFEEERQRVCRRYGLYDIARQSAIDMVCAIAKEHFNCSIATVSVVLDDREVCASMVGFPPMEADPTLTFAIPLREAICSHLMTRVKEDDAFWLMDDVRLDWRFSSNPHVKSGGMCFLASCNIFLPTSFPPTPSSSTATSPPPNLPCGSICILDTNTGRKFSAEDESFLKQLGVIVGRELQLEYEQRRQITITSQTAFLGEFLRSSLVLPHNLETKSLPSEQLSRPFQDTAKNLQKLISADAFVILDLRAFNASHNPGTFDNSSAFSLPFATSAGSSRSANTTSTSYFEGLSDSPRRGGLLSGLAPGAGVISVLGGVGYDWEAVVGMTMTETKAAISQSLMHFYANGISEFDSSVTPSPLASILPSTTTASLACPIFDYDGKPALLLVAVSSTSYFRFESADRQFVENVGAVAIGSLLRRRILEADRAKLAFVSQVSHELRTPLHAIGSQLELIRIVTAPPYLDTIKPLLAVAEVCVTSLREILDDTLTFAKMSNPTDSAPPARKLQEVILEHLVEDVVKSCWARTRQHAAVSGDANGDVLIGANGAGANVKIVMEIDGRYSGCTALVDVGGLKRVLFNLIGNALKFTVGGTIKIIIKVLRPPTKSRSNFHSVGIDVVDTGVGMSEDFLKEQLFIPFRQLDSFSSGAGLGISICDNIVKRMNGTLQFSSVLGVGTTASVSVPLELFFENTVSTNTANTTPRLRTRVISDELNELLDPSHFEEVSTFTSPLPAIELATPKQQEIKKLVKLVPKTSPTIPVLASRLRSSSLVDNSEEILVLIVDDNIIARKILTTFLSVKGVRFIEAENGLDAVEAFKSFGPSLVWCDIQMPILDGLEATRRMRIYEKEHDLSPAHIVALSGLSEDGAHASAVSSGQISQWLTKGGRSLKTLGEGLAVLQAEGIEQAARNQRATAFEIVAQVLRKGLIPSEAMLDALAYAIPIAPPFQLLPLIPKTLDL